MHKKGKPHAIKNASDVELIEKVIKINRVNKVVSGGKRLAFRAFVIVGDGNGRVGIGLGKSKEVPVAIRKAVDRAKKDMVEIVRIDSRTIPHPVNGKFGSAEVIMKPAKPGTGVIAGGAVRILLEAAGIKDIVAKSVSRSSNPINNSKAALDGLFKCKVFDEVSRIRGVKISLGYTPVVEGVE